MESAESHPSVYSGDQKEISRYITLQADIKAVLVKLDLPLYAADQMPNLFEIQ